MNEKLQRLAMHAFRGVPSDMTVDFGHGESTVVYGDNGTGKSTIADALEWYFTGEIELLSHEGRQHAVRYVGGDADGVTSVEVLTSGTLGGKVVFPDERTPEMFHALRRETFLLRGRTLADFINKTKTEKWKALVEILGLDAIESLREDLQRARNDLRKTSKAAEEEARVYRRALSDGADTVTEETVLANLQQICGMLGVNPPKSLDRVVEPSWITAVVGASSSVSASSDRENLLSEINALGTPEFDNDVLAAWNALVSSDRARQLPRASLVREAKRLVEAAVHRGGTMPALRTEGRPGSAGAKDRGRARRDDGGRLATWSTFAIASPPGGCSRECARAPVGRFTIAPAELQLEIPPVPARPDPRIPRSGRGAGVCRHRPGSRAISPTCGAGTRRRPSWRDSSRQRSPVPRDSQLVMLAALCQQINSWQQAEKKNARAQRALAQAETVFDAYQQKQKEDLGNLLEQISGRVAKIYSALHPAEDLDAVSIEHGLSLRQCPLRASILFLGLAQALICWHSAASITS